MTTNLDHVVVAANTLEQGVAYIEREFGVDIPQGGEHPAMGTHNHLMRIGEDIFLEVIAVNPKATAPNMPRWYGLDDPWVKYALAKEPQLLGWVINTDSIESLLASQKMDFGNVKTISRGDLNWNISIPEDGRLLASGLVPYVIEWGQTSHPISRMKDLGCSFISLELYHSNIKWIESILSPLQVSPAVGLFELPNNSSPYFIVNMKTSNGIKTLSSIGNGNSKLTKVSYV